MCALQAGSLLRLLIQLLPCTSHTGIDSGTAHMLPAVASGLHTSHGKLHMLSCVRTTGTGCCAAWAACPCGRQPHG